MPSTSKPARGKVDSQGRVLIPAEHRRDLGMEPGDNVVLQVVDGELRIITVDASIRRAQELVRKYVPEGRLLSEELIADRRADAARESSDGS